MIQVCSIYVYRAKSKQNLYTLPECSRVLPECSRVLHIYTHACIHTNTRAYESQGNGPWCRRLMKRALSESKCLCSRWQQC